MKGTILIVLFSGLLIFSSCTTLSVPVPEGFAKVQEEGEIFFALSPEGFRYQVRLEKNYPPQSGEFWQETLLNQLSREGYILVEGPLSLSRTDFQGFVLVWGVPYRDETYAYLTGVIASEDTLAIAEAAGPYSLYREYREAILKSLEKVLLK